MEAKTESQNVATTTARLMRLMSMRKQWLAKQRMVILRNDHILAFSEVFESSPISWNSFSVRHISVTFELTGDTCALLLVGVAHAFGMVGHVQQSVRRIANCMLKEFQEVGEVSNTSPNMRMWSFLETAILCFASRCSLVLIELAADFKR